MTDTNTTPAASPKFEVGRTYATRSACNWDCVFEFTVISRTAKQVTFSGTNGETNRRGVYVQDGREFCKPHGTHSMCPVLDAMEDDLIEGGIRSEVEAKARREAAAPAPAPAPRPETQEELELSPLNAEAQEALDLVVARHGVEVLRNWTTDQILSEANALLHRSKFSVVS
jgi:hypothetical protein